MSCPTQLQRFHKTITATVFSSIEGDFVFSRRPYSGANIVQRPLRRPFFLVIRQILHELLPNGSSLFTSRGGQLIRHFGQPREASWPKLSKTLWPPCSLQDLDVGMGFLLVYRPFSDYGGQSFYSSIMLRLLQRGADMASQRDRNISSRVSTWSFQLLWTS